MWLTMLAIRSKIMMCKATIEAVTKIAITGSGGDGMGRMRNSAGDSMLPAQWTVIPALFRL
jgi:hypothetical protein